MEILTHLGNIELAPGANDPFSLAKTYKIIDVLILIDTVLFQCTLATLKGQLLIKIGIVTVSGTVANTKATLLHFRRD